MKIQESFAFISVWIQNDFMLYRVSTYVMLPFSLQDGPILSIGTGNKSWWHDNGIGCQPPSTVSPDDSSSSSPSSAALNTVTESEEPVPGCFLQYYYVEIIHAGVQCLLAVSQRKLCYLFLITTQAHEVN